MLMLDPASILMLEVSRGLLLRFQTGNAGYSSMQVGQEKYGMQTFNQALATLYAQKQISLQTALARSNNADELQDMVNRGAGILQPSKVGASTGALRR